MDVFRDRSTSGLRSRPLLAMGRRNEHKSPVIAEVTCVRRIGHRRPPSAAVERPFVILPL